MRFKEHINKRIFTVLIIFYEIIITYYRPTSFRFRWNCN